MSTPILSSNAVPTPASQSPPDSGCGFFMPDFWKMCPFPTGYHKDGDIVSFETPKWFETLSKSDTPSLLQTVLGCRSGELAATVYHQPVISPSALRLVSDFLLLLFIMDDLSDLMDRREVQTFEDTVINALKLGPSTHFPNDTQEPLAARLFRDWSIRVSLHPASESLKARVICHIKHSLDAMKDQASLRASGYLPSIDEYIHHRRLTSGCVPSADMIELALGFELPDEVLSHPSMCIMIDAMNDFVSFSNDVFSYSNEMKRSTSDAHNMVALLQKKYGMGLQAAVDYVGVLCANTVKAYNEAREKLPSFGPKLDKDIAAYCQGLENWMSGNLEWSFVASRYFGDATTRDKVRKTLWVSLENHRVAPCMESY